MDPENAHIVSPYVGGAFGSKGPMTVRCVVSRRLAYVTHTYRAETQRHVHIGADNDGRITAFGHEGWKMTSRPDPYIVGGKSTTARMDDYGSVLTHASMVHTDPNTPGYLRSPPETPHVYALENAMDAMAVALGMDPLEFRRITEL